VRLDDAPDFEEMERIADESYLRLCDRSEIRGQLALGLGVSVEALDALRVGLRGESVFSWPMRDQFGRVVGIRIRDQARGTKYAIRGSRNALFLPWVDERELVIVCEGETDTAAALSLDFYAVGRPSCSGGTELFLRWLSKRSKRDVIVVGDNDRPGIQGASDFAAAISAHAETVQIVVGPGGWKDLRQAVKAGYSRDDLFDDYEAGITKRRPSLGTEGNVNGGHQ